ncbi:hypothetical protein QNH46_06395 [Paenibacillus woosongensis]|uniref:Uncharacterized protein n=1 Tax=Paenibacillus woosongensis TaxID=307580 RepID=A0AA95L2D7_9BACL|nr:hypothetical protein [Paenibacillus woosongensis]WHX50291.1 hypothetical protein QNH46_06395 [Paenibacillus woosongensis]
MNITQKSGTSPCGRPRIFASNDIGDPQAALDFREVYQDSKHEEDGANDEQEGGEPEVENSSSGEAEFWT